MNEAKNPPHTTGGPGGCQQLFVLPLVGRWTLLGDVHGKLSRIPKLDHGIIQVGDMGLGFCARDQEGLRVGGRGDLWFIRGNHDNPARCRTMPNYLGDWGGDSSLFWLGGAWSIDRAWRVEGRDWWPDEEVGYLAGCDALTAYIAAKPRVMISHDGPESLFSEGGPMGIRGYRKSGTANLLQAMLEAHQPEAWFFGHHHISRDFVVGPTRFRCLAELETATLDFHADGSVSWQNVKDQMAASEKPRLEKQ